MKKDKLYKKAYLKWGKESQIKMLFEEMAELTKALCHADRGRVANPKQAVDNIVDELVDVEIMLEQTAEIYLIPRKRIELHKKVKLERLEKLVKE